MFSLKANFLLLPNRKDLNYIILSLERDTEDCDLLGKKI